MHYTHFQASKVKVKELHLEFCPPHDTAYHLQPYRTPNTCFFKLSTQCISALKFFILILTKCIYVYHSPPGRTGTLTPSLYHRPKNISWLYPHKKRPWITAYHTTDNLQPTFLQWQSQHGRRIKIDHNTFMNPRTTRQRTVSFRHNKHPKGDHHTSPHMTYSGTHS
jgi:hypothetical protein